MIDTECRTEDRQMPRFVPVIFANGTDDDAPGLQACADNEPVQFDDNIYEANEDIEIIGRQLVCMRDVIFDPPPNSSRKVLISGCNVDTHGHAFYPLWP